MVTIHVINFPVTSHSLMIVLLILCTSWVFSAQASTTLTTTIPTTTDETTSTPTNTTTTSNSSANATPQCEEGFFGFQCQKECSPNCVAVGCHDMTGECLGGCKVGWHGEMCEYACQEGTYGYNCSSLCPDNCIGGVCDRSTGRCYKGCNDGFLGDQCGRVCIQGKWGENCKWECSTNCATPNCHFQTGYCLRGCKEDFWGPDCSLFGLHKRIPPKMRAHFYSQLSAESRSVLLYILMGKNEQTIHDAKEMVKDGINQRVEMRQLLSGRGGPRARN